MSTPKPSVTGPSFDAPGTTPRERFRCRLEDTSALKELSAADPTLADHSKDGAFRARPELPPAYTRSALDQLLVACKSLDIWALHQIAYKRLKLLQLVQREAGPHSDVSGYTEAVPSDLIGHFLLKLSFCVSEDSAEWFVAQETKLFQYRLQSYSDSVLVQAGLDESELLEFEKTVQPLLQALEVKYELLIRNARGARGSHRFWDDLGAACGASDACVKILFWPCGAPFARHRKCLLKGGYAFVSLRDAAQLAVTQFSKKLLKSCQACRLHLRECPDAHFVRSHGRLQGLLRRLRSSYLGVARPGVPSNTTNADLEAVTSTNISQVALRSFPLCMRILYRKLTKTHHLRHFGRLQFWLFLKEAKMSMEDQIFFWRKAWLDPAKFDKEIKYNIRHAYGQEGRKTSYNAFNCSKIISGLPIPAVNEYHGCPFKTCDSSSLRATLMGEFGLQQSSLLASVFHQKETHQYQLACCELFRLLHKGHQAESVGNHPNEYFNESCRYYKCSGRSSLSASTAAVEIRDAK